MQSNPITELGFPQSQCGALTTILICLVFNSRKSTAPCTLSSEHLNQPQRQSRNPSYAPLLVGIMAYLPAGCFQVPFFLLCGPTYI